MKIIGDVVKELAGMFLVDARSTGAILGLVALVAMLIAGLRLGPALAGGVLLFGALAILVESTWRAARSRTDR
jgi:hypothetical protein